MQFLEVAEVVQMVETLPRLAPAEEVTAIGMICLMTWNTLAQTEQQILEVEEAVD